MATDKSRRPPEPGAWVRPLLLLLLGLLVLYAALFFYYSLRQSFAFAEIHYAEGTWFFAALRVKYGLSPYFDYSHAPYIAMIYPPLDPGISGLAARLFGLSDDGMVPLVRLLSLASTVAASGGVFALCRALGCGPLPAALGALLVLTPNDTLRLWGHVARSDMLAVALGLWALFFVLLRPRGWALVAGGALAGLALTAKQTELAPLLATAWWLLPRRRQLALYLAGVIPGLVVPLAPVGADGLRLLLNAIVDLQAQPILGEALLGRARDLLGLFGPVIPLSLAGLARGLTPPDGRGLAARYVGMAGLVFLLTAGKVGTASQYTLELLAAFSFLVGLGAQWLLEARHAGLPRDALSVALVLVTACIGVQTVYALNNAQVWRDPLPDERPLREIDAVKTGPILSENGLIALRGPDPPTVLDPYYFSVLETIGRWDEKPLASMVEARRFSAVLFSRPVETPFVYQGVRWIPPEVLDAVARNYVLLKQQGRYYVYVPRR